MPWTPLLIIGSKVCRPLADLLSAFPLVDCFRHFHPSVRQYTFRRPGVAPSRLDRAYVPPLLLSSVSSVTHLPTTSDHAVGLLWDSLGSASGLPPPLVLSHTGSSTPPSWLNQTLDLSLRLNGWRSSAAGLRPLWPPPGGMRSPSPFSGTSAKDSPKWWPITRGRQEISFRLPWSRPWRLRIGLESEAAGLGWKN